MQTYYSKSTRNKNKEIIPDVSSLNHIYNIDTKFNTPAELAQHIKEKIETFANYNIIPLPAPENTYSRVRIENKKLCYNKHDNSMSVTATVYLNSKKAIFKFIQNESIFKIKATILLKHTDAGCTEFGKLAKEFGNDLNLKFRTKSKKQ